MSQVKLNKVGNIGKVTHMYIPATGGWRRKMINSIPFWYKNTLSERKVVALLFANFDIWKKSVRCINGDIEILL